MVNKRAGIYYHKPGIYMRCALGLMLILKPGGVPFFQLWRRASSASRLAIEHPVASSSTSRWYIRSEAS